MQISSRNRFIVSATLTYVIVALAWILLSDSLVKHIADPRVATALNTIKGLFFIAVTGIGFYLAMRAVPHHQANTPLLRATGAALQPMASRGLLQYGFAAGITLAAVPMLPYLPSANLMLFMPGIIASAALGGLGPGLLATGITAVAGLHWGRTPDYPLYVGLLVLCGALLSVLGAVVRASLRDSGLRRSLLDGVVSGTTDAVYIKDNDGKYLYANRAAANFLSTTPEAMLGRDDDALFPESTAALRRMRDAAIMAENAIHTAEESLVTPSGRELIFLSTCGPLTDAEGNVRGMFGISRNITIRKEAEGALRVSEQRLQTVMAATSDGLWDWNLGDGTAYITEGVTRLSGMPADTALSLRALLRAIHPDDTSAVLAHLRGNRNGDDSAVDIEFRFAHGDDAPVWVHAAGRVVERAADGAARRMVGTLADITERRNLEQIQREADTVFAGTHEGIMVVDADLRIARVNPAFERITGYRAAEVIGGTPSLLASGRHSKAFYRDMWHTLKRDGFWRGEIWNARKSGEVYPELLTISAVRGHDGNTDHYIGVFSDVSHIKAHAAELDRAANFDALTGLPNRRLLTDRFENAIQRAIRTGKPLTVCVLDLDEFKHVNTRFGKSAGDRLLTSVAQALHTQIRADDTLARIGGDEFVLLMAGVGSPGECAHALDRILQAVARPHDIGGHTVGITASIGVTSYPIDNGGADTLLRHAEQAMYLAKQEGRNRYQLFDPVSDHQAQVHRESVQRLRLALERGEFRLHYQPKVDLRTSALVGVEALIRWQHPERGLVPPGEFLPHIVGTPLETDIGNWVIAAALEQCHRWRGEGLHVPVSVNVGAAQLLAPGFAEALADALVAHPGTAPGDLELEVLETAAIEDLGQAMSVLDLCNTLGVHFALDDFGTGYSSLTYLRQLPVNTLKVDQSFVRNMLHDPADYGIVDGVVKMAHAMKLAVVAEGVETAGHYAALRAMGCEIAQGYGIARPMAPELLPAWAAERGAAPGSATIATAAQAMRSAMTEAP